VQDRERLKVIYGMAMEMTCPTKTSTTVHSENHAMIGHVSREQSHQRTCKGGAKSGDGVQPV
jgi:hypothetical protein